MQFRHFPAAPVLSQAMPSAWRVRNVCLVSDGTVRSEAEGNKPLSQMNSTGQALAAPKYTANDLAFVIAELLQEGRDRFYLGTLIFESATL